MGTYIKGMTCPKSCSECRFFHKAFKGIGLDTTVLLCPLRATPPEYPEYYHSRGKDCPLVALPPQHGRLVDADELTVKAEFYETEMELKTAPTIIEAEL